MQPASSQPTDSRR